MLLDFINSFVNGNSNRKKITRSGNTVSHEMKILTFRDHCAHANKNLKKTLNIKISLYQGQDALIYHRKKMKSFQVIIRRNDRCLETCVFLMISL